MEMAMKKKMSDTFKSNETETQFLLFIYTIYKYISSVWCYRSCVAGTVIAMRSHTRQHQTFAFFIYFQPKYFARMDALK